MSETCPVVTIATKNGPVDINESDFDKKIHTLYSEDKKLDGAENPKQGTKAWLEHQLKDMGIEIPDGAKKADLEKLLADSKTDPE